MQLCKATNPAMLWYGLYCTTIYHGVSSSCEEESTESMPYNNRIGVASRSGATFGKHHPSYVEVEVVSTWRKQLLDRRSMIAPPISGHELDSAASG
jgi:hypothetical protein